MRFDALALDIERIGTILRDLVLIVDAHDTKMAQAKLIQVSQPIAPKQPLSGAAKFTQKPANPLAAIQMENILREDILSGKIKVHLNDVMHVETGRVLLRQIVCALHGRQPEFRSDDDFVKAGISPGIIQLFDRMRFGFAFEFAGQFGAQSPSTPVLCSLKDATFGNSDTADEIVGIIERQSEMSRTLILALDHNLLMHPTPQEDERLRRLQIAGCVMAANLTQDAMVEPDILVERGVRYALADMDMLFGRNGQVLKSAIHPADLASYLSRRDITLIAQNVDSPADMKALKSIGIIYASGSAVTRNGIDTPNMHSPSLGSGIGGDEITAAIANADLATRETSVTSIAPLRERLRRVRT
jgi:EAL domain-containing protein (putative c-di-GMP-specific phosphodiesterase class I)